MNKAQIKAELRRSACFDKRPFYGVDGIAFVYAFAYKRYYETISSAKREHIAIFFLLVAEAL